MVTAPIIIPILVVIVVVVAVILMIFHLIKKLVGCPNHKQSYPFDPKSASKRKSTLPTSAYTIEPSGDISGNSSFFGKSVVGGAMLYPALSAGHHRSHHHSSTPDTNHQDRDQSFSLDTVDNTMEDATEVLIGADTPSPGSNTTREEHSKLPISRNNTPDIPISTPSPTNYDDRSSPFNRQSEQYDQQQDNQFNSGSNNFESDV